MPYKNPEDRKKYSAQYRIKNKDKIDAYRNKQENKDRKLAWKRENRDWLNQYKRERKIKLGKFVEGVIDKCRVCGKEFSKKGPNNKYCSKKCQFKSKNKYPDGERPKLTPEEQRERNVANSKKYYYSPKGTETRKKYNELDSTKKKIDDYRSTDEYKKTHRKKNAEYFKTSKGRAVSRKYEKNRKKRDPEYRMRINLRRRLTIGFKAQGTYKNTGTLKLLGCSWGVFKDHIRKKFKPGMTWDNYGKWHIDHIKPMSKFNLLLKEEQFKCCNYKNLQPLWAEENLKKRDTYKID